MEADDRERVRKRLFAYYSRSTRRRHEIRADMINEHLRDLSGEQMTAEEAVRDLLTE